MVFDEKDEARDIVYTNHIIDILADNFDNRQLANLAMSLTRHLHTTEEKIDAVLDLVTKTNEPGEIDDPVAIILLTAMVKLSNELGKYRAAMLPVRELAAVLCVKQNGFDPPADWDVDAAEKSGLEKLGMLDKRLTEVVNKQNEARAGVQIDPSEIN